MDIHDVAADLGAKVVESDGRKYLDTFLNTAGFMKWIDLDENHQVIVTPKEHFIRVEFRCKKNRLETHTIFIPKNPPRLPVKLKISEKRARKWTSIA